MISQASSLWALLFGMALITIGNGLQGTVLGVRGVLEGFSTGTLGVIMSAYYGGFLLGSLYVQKLVQEVGHIRVFAAFASLASIAILAHSVILDPIIWALIRIVSGFSFAGLFVVTESWLNDQCHKENRGKILSLYMTINHGGFLIGQMLLNLAHPEEFSHFILVSVLLSFSLIPILIRVSPFPSFESLQPISIKEIYKNSPTALIGGIGVGVAHGSIWGMGPVYAYKIGLDINEVSLFMGVTILGGFLLQWPIGILSDRFDRRSVLFHVIWLASLFALAGAFVSKAQILLLLSLMFCFGGLSLPLYSLCIAHLNDNLDRKQMVSGSSAMILLYGVGALLGPLMSAACMEVIGKDGFYYHLAFVHVVLGLFVYSRIRTTPPVPLEEQEAFVPIPARTSHLISTLTPIPDDKPQLPNQD